MNFNTMAEIVHELSQGQRTGDTEVLKAETAKGLTFKEQEAIICGFSKVRLSGESAAIEIGPNVYWA